MNKHEVAANTPDTRQNVGLSKDVIVRMDAKRARRFWREMAKLDGAIETLAGAAQALPTRDYGPGDVIPEILIKAMTDMMRETAFLLFAMLNYEEHITEGLQEKEGGTSDATTLQSQWP